MNYLLGERNLRAALRLTGYKRVIAGGGVTANSELRRIFEEY